jgi:hypothetical protein
MLRNGYKLPKKKSLKPTHKTKIGTTNMWGITNSKTFGPIIMIVVTPLWPSVGVKPNTWKSWRFKVLRDSQMFRAQQQGPKHLALKRSWCHWKGLET